jgi:hydrogenase maturation protease
MAARVLVAGIGNIFLGDDGFGPEVVRRLAAEDGLPPGVTVTDYGIRGMHLAYDLLAGYDAVVLVDALPVAGSPGEVVVLEIGPDDLGPGEFDAHGMNPMAVLAGLTRLGGTLPPTYVVGFRTADVTEGIGLSPAATAALPTAIAAIRALLARIGTDDQRRRRSTPAVTQPAASRRY